MRCSTSVLLMKNRVEDVARITRRKQKAVRFDLGWQTFCQADCRRFRKRIKVFKRSGVEGGQHSRYQYDVNGSDGKFF